jgi:hypothetical protein
MAMIRPKSPGRRIIERQVLSIVKRTAKSLAEQAKRDADTTIRMSLGELVYSTINFEDVMRAKANRNDNAGTVDIYNVEVDGAVGVKTLTFRSEGVGRQSPILPSRWRQIIIAHGVEFSKEKDGQFIIPVDVDGKAYYAHRLTEMETPVRVRCSCPDFLHRFAYPDFGEKSLQGRPKPYTRKTTTYPPVNPNNIPGLCKHILALTSLINNSGFIGA